MAFSFDKIGENFGKAFSGEGIANTGIFMGIGALAGAAVGGFSFSSMLPILLGAGAGLLTAGLSGLKIIGNDAGAGDKKPDGGSGAYQSPQQAAGFVQTPEVKPNLPPGLTGNIQAPAQPIGAKK